MTTRDECHRVLPDGAMDVLFFGGSSVARVIGPMTRALTVSARGESRVAGIRFRLGAAFEILGITARELRDASVDVGDIWGARGRTLSAQLAEAPDLKAMVGCLASEIEAVATDATLPPDPRVARAVTLLEANGGELRAHDVLRNA